VCRLETKRQTKASAYNNTKKELAKLHDQAVKNTSGALKDVNAKLAAFGY